MGLLQSIAIPLYGLVVTAGSSQPQLAASTAPTRWGVDFALRSPVAATSSRQLVIEMLIQLLMALDDPDARSRAVSLAESDGLEAIAQDFIDRYEEQGVRPTLTPSEAADYMVDCSAALVTTLSGEAELAPPLQLQLAQSLSALLDDLDAVAE
jgi:hypothetical protein